MMVRMMRVGAFLALCGGLVASVAACDFETNPASLVITGNVVPDEKCTVKSTGGGQQTVLSQGTLDLSVGTRYVMNLMIANKFPTLESVAGFQAGEARIEPGDITLEAVQVKLGMNTALITENPEVITALGELGFAANVEAATEYLRPVAVVIPVTSSGAVTVDVIPHNVGQLLRNIPTLASGTQSIEIIIEIQAIGRRADNGIVRSNTMKYPVTVCNNCLIRQVVSDAEAINPFAGENTEITVPCAPGADAPVDNNYCGFVFGPEANNLACSLNRCLGKVVTAGGAGGTPPLVCPEDSSQVTAPIVID